MSSFEDLFHAAAQHARQPLTTSAEAAATAAHLLALGNMPTCQLASPWDLAKLASSIIRCALANAAGHGVCEGLHPLLATAFHLCPCAACANLSVVLKTKCYSQLQRGVADRLGRRLARNSEGALVVLSLLSLWHHAECVAGCEWDGYVLLSTFVGEAVPLLSRIAGHETTNSSGGGTVAATYARSWIANLLDYGVRRPEHTQDVVAFLDAQSADKTEDKCQTVCLIADLKHSDPVYAQWLVLERRMLAESARPIAQYCQTVRETWSSVATPILSHATTQEPPPLSEVFFTAPQLTSADCVRLATEALPALAAASRSDALERLFNQLGCLQRTAQLLAPVAQQAPAEERHILQEPGLTVEVYTRYVKPAVIVALRTGRTTHAASLLGWAADALPTCDAEAIAAKSWRRRLVAAQRREVLAAAGSLLYPRKNGVTSWDEWVALTVPRLDTDSALDVLVTSDDLTPLRVVLDACLLPPPRPHRTSASAANATETWPRKVLTDPLASTFLCSALAKVVQLLLNDGEAPLARVYLTRLLLCVRACPAHGCLLLLLKRLARMGLALTAGSPLVALPSGGVAAHEQWCGIYSSLQHLVPSARSPRCALDDVPWELYNENKYRLRCDSLLSTATVVLVEVDADDVVLERRWRTATGELATAALRLVNRRHALEAVVEEVQAIAKANRSQLQQGSTGICPAAEVARTDSSTSLRHPEAGTSPELPAPVEAEDKEACKLAWWRQRFDLDAALFTSIERLEAALGRAGAALLLGELAAELQVPLWELAGQLVAALASDEAYSDIREVLLSGNQFRALCYCVLQALPYVVRNTGESHSSAKQAHEEEHLRVKYVFNQRLAVCSAAQSLLEAASPTSFDSQSRCGNEECLCWPGTWHRLYRGLVTAVGELLVAASAEWAQVPTSTSAKDSSISSSAPVDAESTDVYERTVQSVVKLMMREVARTSGDLTQLSRQHVYLLLESKVYALPMEGLWPLRQRSCSRLPLSFAEHIPADERVVNSCSVARTHLVVDVVAAAASRVSLDKMLAQHAAWTVEYCDTTTPATGRSNSNSTGDASRSLLERFAEERNTCYVYMGHKRGERLLTARQLYTRLGSAVAAADKFPALVLLMGCSSARMLGGEGFRSFGMPCAYLHAGARGFIGCLWDITDGEIDKLTCRFLSLAARGADDLTVGEALAAARSVCKLPCLTATATVLCGFNSPLGGALNGDQAV